MAEYRLLGIAAASGKIGYAFLEGDQLVDWGLSRKASESADAAAAKVRLWIDKLRPEAVICEALSERTRKKGKTLSLLAAIAQVARDAPVVNVTAERMHNYKNKYEEAQALVRKFPELESRLRDKPPFWKGEPSSMILFEAVSLALSVNLAEEW